MAIYFDCLSLECKYLKDNKTPPKVTEIIISNRQSHKFHNKTHRYPTVHDFFYRNEHISVRKWGIVGLVIGGFLRLGYWPCHASFNDFDLNEMVAKHYS